MAQVNYSIPSWLEQTPDVAGKFLSGVQVGAAIGEARNKLAAQQQQFAVEAQQKQDQITASAMKEAQELNVQKAYNDQQISLKQQALQIADQKVGQETLKAAHQYQAQQAYQKDFADFKAQGYTDDDAAKASMFRNLSMFGSGAGAGTAALRSMNRAEPPTTKVLTDTSGNQFTAAYIPGKGEFQILKQGSSALDNFDYRHNIQRKERLDDRQFSSVERKLTAAQKVLDAADESLEGQSANKAIQENYQKKKQKVAILSAQMDKLSTGTNSTPPTDTATPASTKWVWNPKTRQIEPTATAQEPSDQEETDTEE